MMRQLFEQVRVQGKIDMKQELALRDILPVIYKEEADPTLESAVPYYNSGGRAILFEKGKTIYRVKGVDPHARLTQRVAESQKNKIKNVRDAHALAQSQLSKKAQGLSYDERKPFDPFFLSQAESEIESFKRLGEIYNCFGIENPCEYLFYKNTGITFQDQCLYQTVFRLPRLEADLRVHEFDSLLTERLDECSPSEIAEKSHVIGRLYGRFIYWAGLNTGILAAAGLLPTSNSFHPQNWVISRYQEGYGIFRVDHTSTKIVDQREALQNLTTQRDGVPYIINEFSVFPSRVQVAANPRAYILQYQGTLKFSDILHARKGIGVDESKIVEAHRTVFNFGLQSVIERNPIAPIPEEMFKEALA